MGSTLDTMDRAAQDKGDADYLIKTQGNKAQVETIENWVRCTGAT